MAEEVIPKKTGVERQAEILVAALERASQNGGILLNEKEKLKTSLLQQEADHFASQCLGDGNAQ